MDNREWIKTILYDRVEMMTDEELYRFTCDYLADGNNLQKIGIPLCGCKDGSVEDAKRRFSLWLNREHIRNRTEDTIAEEFDFAQVAEFLNGKAVIMYDIHNEMYFGLAQCCGWTEHLEGVTLDQILNRFKSFVKKKLGLERY